MAWTFATGVVALVVAGVGARAVGRLLRSRPAVWYSAASVAVFVVAVALFVLSSASLPTRTVTADAVQGLALGLGFGGMAGLRYGYKGLFELGQGRARS